jgi:hypothetical protein
MLSIVLAVSTRRTLALRELEGASWLDEGGWPNAQVQGRALGMAEASSGGGVPCNAQLGRCIWLGIAAEKEALL